LTTSTFATDGGHWYAQDGTPAYEVLGKDGISRKTTLRDAKKYGYFPGVGDISRRAPKGWDLENWERNKLIRLCRENPEASADAIKKLYFEEAEAIMNLGSAIHTCIECHQGGKPYDHTYRPHAVAALDRVNSWCGLDGLLPERSFYHPLGFGGRCDVHKQWKGDGIQHVGYVADYKTKDFDERQTLSVYNNHAMQLAAYRHGFGMPTARCAIIFISTRVPGVTQLVELEQKQLDKGWLMFCNLLEGWQIEKNYRPNKEGLDENIDG
jgi:hypothetical protein